MVFCPRFPDGGDDDAALLKRVNPIPLGSDELESDVDGCIFIGNLRDESDVAVTITGGCPFESNFEVNLEQGCPTKIIPVDSFVKVTEIKCYH